MIDAQEAAIVPIVKADTNAFHIDGNGRHA